MHFLACEIITHSLTLTVAEVHNASGSKHREASCRDIHLLQPELFVQSLRLGYLRLDCFVEISFDENCLSAVSSSHVPIRFTAFFHGISSTWRNTNTSHPNQHGPFHYFSLMQSERASGCVPLKRPTVRRDCACVCALYLARGTDLRFRPRKSKILG